MSAPTIPAVGQRLCEWAEFEALPLGSVILSDDDARFIRQGDGWYGCQREADGYTVGEPYYPEPRNYFSLDYNRVERVGYESEVVPGHGVETVAECMDRVREAIDYCARDNGYEDARTAAYWRLGMDAMPEEGHTIRFGTACGLPHGSVIRTSYYGESTLWTISKDNINPAMLVSSNANDRARDSEQAEVILRTHWETPVYEHRNEFLHRVWELQYLWRRLFNWCPAVERALLGADLDDPGPNAGQPVPLRVHGVLTPGYVTTGNPDTIEQMAFHRLNDGSVAQPAGVAPRVKHGSEWLSVVTLRPDNEFYSRGAVTVISVC